MATTNTDWRAAGTTGEIAELWCQLSNVALALLKEGEVGYALIHQIVTCVEYHFDQEDAAATREP